MAKQAKDPAGPVGGEALALPVNEDRAKRDELLRQLAGAEREAAAAKVRREAARAEHVAAMAATGGRLRPDHPAVVALAEADAALARTKQAAKDYHEAAEAVEEAAGVGIMTDVRTLQVEARRLQGHNARLALAALDGQLLNSVRSRGIERTYASLSGKALPPGRLLDTRGTRLPSLVEEMHLASLEVAREEIGGLRRRLQGWVSRGWLALEDLAHLPGFDAVDAERRARMASQDAYLRPAREAQRTAEAAAKAAKDAEAKRKAKDKADAAELRRRNAEALAAQFAERFGKATAK